MAEEGKDTSSRSLLNRLAGLGAGQEQLQADVDELREMVKTLVLVGFVAALMLILIYAAIRNPTILKGVAP